MLFDQKLDVNAVPALMNYVFRIAPYGLWAKRFSILHEQEKRNPLLSEYFDDEFPLERIFEAVQRYHKVTGRYPGVDEVNYELFSFLALVKLVHERLSETGRSRLQSSVRDGLQDDKGLGPLATELRTSSQLMGQGFEVEFTDLDGRERYDLLASNGKLEIEIDCKAPSGDVGRCIHKWRFRAFANDLMPSLRELAECGEGHLVHVTIPGNLHGDREFERKVVEETVRVVQGKIRGEDEDPSTTVSLRTFEVADSPFKGKGPVPLDIVSEFLKNRFGLENVNAICDWRPGRGAVIVSMQSIKKDHVVDGIYRQLKGSAEKQISARRPAMLCVQLRAVTGPQLRELAKEPVNGLAAIATRLFSGDKRGHLACISFVSPSGTLTRTRSIIAGGVLRTSHQDIGAAYVFANPRHPLGLDVDGVFREKAIPEADFRP
jgi:hypothetical protein